MSADILVADDERTSTARSRDNQVEFRVSLSKAGREEDLHG